jgi:hypothetical protein
MNLQLIIDEADVRVPNAFAVDQKVDWLNEINYEFFDIVKIPKSASVAVDGIATQFTIPTDVREKNIRKVVVGSNYYRSIVYEEITAAFNYYTIDETTNKINFTPKPPAGTAVLIYDTMGVIPFVSTTLTAIPVAPTEYHWIYVLGLCVRIAKAMSDVVLANNYENDYKGNLMIAQQNYLRG